MGLLLMEMGVDVATMTEHTTGSGGQKVVSGHGSTGIAARDCQG